jgi:hypothetical protein
MDGIINDVDSMERFRMELLDAVENLQKQLKATDQSLEEISKTWGDSQFHKFKQGFEEDKETINPLCEKIEHFEAGVLKPLEDILRDEYLEL